MNKKDTYLIVIAVIICIAIAVLSPYIASGNPDGLEKSAEDSGAVSYTHLTLPTKA